LGNREANASRAIDDSSRRDMRQQAHLMHPQMHSNRMKTRAIEHALHARAIGGNSRRDMHQVVHLMREAHSSVRSPKFFSVSSS